MHSSSASRFKSFGTVLFLYLAAVIVIPSSLGDSTSNAETGHGSDSAGDPNTSGGGSSGGPIQGGRDPDPATPLGTPTKVGYDSISNGTVPGGDYAFQNFSTGSVVVIPFRFNSLENYTLTSANLLLRTFSGTVSLSDLSVQVYDTLPPNETSLPTPVASFAATGDITSTLGIHTFTATSSLTLEADTTYYFGVAYFGPHLFAWNATTGSETGIGPLYVNDTFLDGTSFSYYVLNLGSSQLTGVVGGFSITAAAISSVPEPATTTALAAGAVLAAALWVRWRRRRASRTDEERAPQA